MRKKERERERERERRRRRGREHIRGKGIINRIIHSRERSAIHVCLERLPSLPVVAATRSVGLPPAG